MADALKQLSIPVRVHLPGVGRNLMDHLAASVQHVREGQCLLGGKARDRSAGSRSPRNGCCSRTASAPRISSRPAPSSGPTRPIKIPNLQYEFIPVVGDFQFGSLALTKGFQYFFALMRPTSRGRVWIDSADPMAAPKFVFNYLSTEEDRRDAVAAVKTTRHIIAQSAWNKCRDREVTPGPRCDERRGDPGASAPDRRNAVSPLRHLPHGP